MAHEDGVLEIMDSNIKELSVVVSKLCILVDSLKTRIKALELETHDKRGDV